MPEVNVRKRGNKWQYEFEIAKIKGKRKQKTKSGFKTKKEALEAGTKALAEYNNSGLLFEPSEISYADYLDYWMEQYVKLNLAQTTYDNYEKKIRLHIKPHLGEYKLKNITAAIIQDFINLKFNEGYSRNTLSVIRGLVVSSCKYAVNPLGFIKENPSINIRQPLARAVPNVPTRKKERVAIPDDILEQIFKRFPENHPAYKPLLLGYTCGLRLGEAFAINLNEDLDLDNGYLLVNHQVQNINGYWTLVNPKYDSFRKIKLDSFTLEELKKAYSRHFQSIEFYGKYYKQLKIDEKNQLNYEHGNPIHLLCTRDDGSYTQPRIMQHVGRVVHYQLNYKPYDFHSLRHTHSVMLMDSGANPKDVQLRLGHKNIETTLKFYADSTTAMQQITTGIIESNNILLKSKNCQP